MSREKRERRILHFDVVYHTETKTVVDLSLEGKEDIRVSFNEWDLLAILHFLCKMRNSKRDAWMNLNAAMKRIIQE